MTTKRTPIEHPPRDRYTRATFEAFRKMVVLENKCTCTDDGEEPCAVCDQWRAQISILCNELWLKPWQFPAVEAPLNFMRRFFRWWLDLFRRLPNLPYRDDGSWRRRG